MRLLSRKASNTSSASRAAWIPWCWAKRKSLGSLRRRMISRLKREIIRLQAGHTGPALNKAFQRAFNVAKHVRTETNIQRGSISVGSVAVELAEKIFTKLDDRDVMVLGAGD